MSGYTLSRRGWHMLHATFACLSMCVLLIACDPGTQQSLPAVVSSATATSVQPPTFTRPEYETVTAQHEAAFATSVALTPPITKIPPAAPPGPTSTVELGLMGCGSPTNSLAPIPISCWRGLIDGHFVDVETGKGHSDDSTPPFGFILVNVWSGNDWTVENETYYWTSERVGGLRIAAIDGTLFTLMSEDGQHTFVFDIATRQWVSFTPGLSPLVETPSPGATPTWSRQALDATAIAVYNTLPALSPNPRSEPTKDADERASQLWHVAIRTAIALYPPPTPITFPGVFTPTPYPPVPAEIVYKRTTSQGVIYDERFVGPPCNEVADINHWYGTAVGERTHVCAGADKDRPGKGGIVVEVWHSGDERPTYSGYYLTPSDQGAVRIQDVIGDQVILVSTNNTIFYFDLATRQWSSPTPGTTASVSLSPIPSVSPIPTGQP